MHEWAQQRRLQLPLLHSPFSLSPSLSLSLSLSLFHSQIIALEGRGLQGAGSLSRHTFAFQFELMTNTNENFTKYSLRIPRLTSTVAHYSCVCVCVCRHLYTGEWAHYEATRGVHAIHQVRCGQHNRYKSAGRTQCTVQCQIRCERATHTGAHGECEHGKYKQG